ncbi:MAG: hypothetical protein QM504_01625 [Pseudomonadota bacterium]
MRWQIIPKIEKARRSIERFYKAEAGFIPDFTVVSIGKIQGNKDPTFQFWRVCPICCDSENGTSYLSPSGELELYGSEDSDEILFPKCICDECGVVDCECGDR